MRRVPVKTADIKPQPRDTGAGEVHVHVRDFRQPKADLVAKIASHAADEAQRARIHSAMSRFTELSSHLLSQLNEADWVIKREIIHAVVQQIEIWPTKIAVVLRIPAETGARA
jgi:hypothetical protein